MRLFSKYCRLGVFLFIVSPFAMAETDAISPKEAAIIVQSGSKAIIVDVRDDDEWHKHHIHGAIHIPLAQLTERLSELAPYKNSPIITQCKRGNRSAQAQTALKSAGFSKVYNMNGGIQAWDKEGLATE